MSPDLVGMISPSFVFLGFIGLCSQGVTQDERKVKSNKGSKVGFRFRAAAVRTQPLYSRPTQPCGDLKMLIFVS